MNAKEAREALELVNAARAALNDIRNADLPPWTGDAIDVAQEQLDNIQEHLDAVIDNADYRNAG